MLNVSQCFGSISIIMATFILVFLLSFVSLKMAFDREVKLIKYIISTTSKMCTSFWIHAYENLLFIRLFYINFDYICIRFQISNGFRNRNENFIKCTKNKQNKKKSVLKFINANKWPNRQIQVRLFLYNIHERELITFASIWKFTRYQCGTLNAKCSFYVTGFCQIQYSDNVNERFIQRISVNWKLSGVVGVRCLIVSNRNF